MSTDVDGAGVCPSMSMRAKSVVGAASGTSSPLCARLQRRDETCSEARRGVQGADEAWPGPGGRIDGDAAGFGKCRLEKLLACLGEAGTWKLWQAD